MNIVLTGFMATGKTEISKAISEISKYNLVDTDDMIVEQEGITINEIFDKCGEEYFRKTECEVIKKAAEMKNVVIATGGGVVLNKQNIENLRKTGVIFNLSPDFSVIRERLEEARKTRPLLKRDSIENIKKRFDDRKPFYGNIRNYGEQTGGRKAMKITREADYALRIIAMLADENRQIEAKAIAEKNDIPYRFTLKILRKIVQAGIIKSYRGVNGGYVLNKKPSEITLKDVIETIDGKIAINKCMENPESCKNNGICKVQRKLYKVQKVLADEMSKITFQDVLEGK